MPVVTSPAREELRGLEISGPAPCLGIPRLTISDALHTLHVEVSHIEGIVLDEAPPVFDVFPHQRGENLVALDQVPQFHSQQGTALGIHSRVPELPGVHLSQTLVALHVAVPRAFVLDVGQQITPVRLTLHGVALYHRERRAIVGGDLPREVAQPAVLRHCRLARYR